MKLSILIDQSSAKWIHEMINNAYLESKCEKPVKLTGKFLFQPNLSIELMHVSEKYGSGRITHGVMVLLNEEIEIEVLE